MLNSHVEIPAPTIVTMFLKPCSRQYDDRPSKVSSGITYSKYIHTHLSNLHILEIKLTLSTIASSLSAVLPDAKWKVCEKKRRIISIVPSESESFDNKFNIYLTLCCIKPSSLWLSESDSTCFVVASSVAAVVVAVDVDVDVDVVDGFMGSPSSAFSLLLPFSTLSFMMRLLALKV